MRFRCKEVDTDTRMFTVGKFYEAIPEGFGYVIVDDLGMHRFLCDEEYPLFVIDHKGGPDNEIPLYARFVRD